MATKNVRVDFKGSKGNLVSVDFSVNLTCDRNDIIKKARRRMSAEVRKLVSLNCSSIKIVDMDSPE